MNQNPRAQEPDTLDFCVAHVVFPFDLDVFIVYPGQGGTDSWPKLK